MPDLFAPVVSIAATKRRRFLWAAWWNAPPARAPFRKPDAAEGGARTHEEALRQATAAAGRALVEIEPLWAKAWARVLIGQPPFMKKSEDPPRPRTRTEGPSIWTTLGVDPRATVEDIKRAFRVAALRAHPDQGGDGDSFRALRRAYEEAMRRRRRTKKP